MGNRYHSEPGVSNQFEYSMSLTTCYYTSSYMPGISSTWYFGVEKEVVENEQTVLEPVITGVG